MRLLSPLIALSLITATPAALQECAETTPAPPHPAEDADFDGYTGLAGDCDDLDDTVYPGAYEVVADKIDSDCDGHSDFISRLAGTGSPGFSGDGGQATSATLRDPFDAVMDGAGNLYISDSGNNRIRKVSPEGIISTVAGMGIGGFAGDGGPAQNAKLLAPRGLAVDAAGDLWVADSGNHRVRRIELSTGIISTVVGAGTPGGAGDGGPAAEASLATPSDLSFDEAGTLYIADTDNNKIRRVSGGIISTAAGTGVRGLSGDGGLATGARLDSPYGVSASQAGLYIADTTNNRIRLVHNGIISTFAGTSGGCCIDGGSATSALLSRPKAVAVDSFGDVYIADSDNYRVRKVIDGKIETVAGSGNTVSGGDNQEDGAYEAGIDHPIGLLVTRSDDLIVVESYDDSVRQVLW